MPRKIEPTSKKKSRWMIHFVIYLIGVALMWFFTYHGKEGFVYPWPAWITAAWGLAVVAHASTVWSNYVDKSYDEFHRQNAN